MWKPILKYLTGLKLEKDSLIINWVTNWLNNRLSLLRNNYLEASKGFNRLSYGGFHPINATIDTIKGNPKGYSTTLEILLDLLLNLNNSRAIVTDDSSKVFPGKDAISLYALMKWDADNTLGKTYLNNLIYYNPENNETKVNEIDPSIRVHESTHTLGNVRGSKILPYREFTPLVEVIRKNYVKFFDNTGYSKQDADYLSKPDEIYARMMLLRYETKLKPNLKVDQKWILKNKKAINKHNLNFKNNKLIDMLNEIAYNFNNNKISYYG